MRPRQFQVSTQLHEPFSFRVAQCGLLLALDDRKLIFKVAHRQQRLVPAPFQLACDQAIVGIHRIILAPCMTGLVAGVLKRQLHLLTFLGDFRGSGSNGIQGRFHAQRLEQPQDLRANRLIDAQAAEGDASISTMVQVSALAMITPYFPGRAAVSDVKLTSAMAASEQQGLAALNGASRHHALAGGIVGNQPLIPLKLRP
jgi:hypothetical protein